MGYIQAKKSGINIPSKYRSMRRDVMSRCSLFLLSPVLAATAGSQDLHCTLPCTLAGIKEISSILRSQTFSTSFLFSALSWPSEALTGTWELKAKHFRLQLWIYLKTAFRPVQMVVRKGLIYSQAGAVWGTDLQGSRGCTRCEGTD